jgi:hypothetical protein
MTTLKINTEGQLKGSEGSVYNYRIYKDGGAKLESANSLDFFDTIEELEKCIAINNLK